MKLTVKYYRNNINIKGIEQEENTMFSTIKSLQTHEVPQMHGKIEGILL